MVVRGGDALGAEQKIGAGKAEVLYGLGVFYAEFVPVLFLQFCLL